MRLEPYRANDKLIPSPTVNVSDSEVEGGDHFQLIKIKGTFLTPTIDFDMIEEDLKITPGDDVSTNWFIKGKLTM
jgi:hypothetical protein